MLVLELRITDCTYSQRKYTERPAHICSKKPFCHPPLGKLLGGIPTPLKNMTSSVGIIIPNIWKVIRFHGSSHHQPENHVASFPAMQRTGLLCGPTRLWIQVFG